MAAAATASSCPWYAIHTHPQHEPLAAFHLRRQNYCVLFLRYPQEIRHARKIRIALRPYFPRYLFAQVTGSQAIGPINRTPGVSSVVTAGGKTGQEPLQVPSPIITELQARADQDGLLAPAPARLRPLLATGEHVQITSGPLQGFPAIVLIDDGTRVRLNIKLLGREITASVEPDAIAVVSPEVRRTP